MNASFAAPAANTSLRFDSLQPHAVLHALEQMGLMPDGRLLQLNSYENRVYQLHLEDGSSVVAKFYRPGRWSDAQILEEHAFALELQHNEVAVIAPQLLSNASATCFGTPPTLAHVNVQGSLHRVSVSPCRVGRGPELDDAHTLAWLGRFLGRLHSTAGSQHFAHRRNLSPQWGRDAVARVLASDRMDEASGPAWQTTCEQALALVQRSFDAQTAVATLRLHGDLHAGNVMWRDGGPLVVDLDDACNGPAVQDLWMLLSGDAVAMREQLGHLLEGYQVFRRFDARELALIEPLRTLRMICHSAWIAERWSDPAFPIAFPFFGAAAYWAQQTTQLREQIALMQDPPELNPW